MERLTGIGVSPGIVVGRAVILTQRTEVMRFPIPPDRVDREVAALHAARDQSRQQLQDISARVAQGPGSELAALFDAQILMLDDPMLIGRAEEIIRTERVNAAWAVHRAYEALYQVFSSMEDPYLRERESDVADVAGRLRMNLRHGATRAARAAQPDRRPAVLIADELTASVAAQLDWSRVQGFATDAGSRTYHTAILARSLKVPAIVGLHDASLRIAAGTPVILDGTSGELVVAPSPELIDEAQRRATRPRTRGVIARLIAARSPPPTASAIRLEANIELLEDLQYLNEYGAEGVGLYRSEFMLSGRTLELRDRRRAVRDVPQPDRAGRAAAGDDSHVRSRRAASRPRSLAHRAPPHPARAARPAARPRQSRGAAHAAARAGARLGARSAAHHVPVRDGCRRSAPGARDPARDSG